MVEEAAAGASASVRPSRRSPRCTSPYAAHKQSPPPTHSRTRARTPSPSLSARNRHMLRQRSPPTRRPRHHSPDASLDSNSLSDSYSGSDSQSRSPPRRGRRAVLHRERRRSPSSSDSRSYSSYSSRSPSRSRSHSRSRSRSWSRCHEHGARGVREMARSWEGRRHARGPRARSPSPREDRRRYPRDGYQPVRGRRYRSPSLRRSRLRSPLPPSRRRPPRRAWKVERHRPRDLVVGERRLPEDDKPRDMRTVFIWQLAQRVRPSDVFACFSEAGRVRDVRLITDRSSTKHKSAGYVEFFDTESVSKAVALNGKLLCGFPVAVKPTVDQHGVRGGLAGPGPGRPADGPESQNDGAKPFDSSLVGWSMTSRRPVRHVDQESSAGPTGGQAAPLPSALPNLVSIEELKVLLNPLGLPIPSRQGTVALPGTGSSLGNLAVDPVLQQGLHSVEQVPLPTAADANIATRAVAPDAFTRLYVGSVAFQLTETDLRAIFDPFGAISSLQLQRDGTGRSRGYGFVEFVNHEAAKKALEINGLLVAGRTLKVALASQENRAIGSAKVADVGPTGVVPLPGPLGQPRGTGADVAGELDEGRDGGLAMNASQRAMLMQELSRGENMGKGAPGNSAKLPIKTEASKSLMLCNMFNPATEPANFELELAEDVRDECASKYGTVTHLHVEARSQGVVFIRFGQLEAAKQARSALNGRWFGGHRIQAYFVAGKDYSDKFPNAPG